MLFVLRRSLNFCFQEASKYSTPQRGPNGKYAAVEQLQDHPQRPTLAPLSFLPPGASPATPPVILKLFILSIDYGS
jgi:hypothetical protein